MMAFALVSQSILALLVVFAIYAPRHRDRHVHYHYYYEPEDEGEGDEGDDDELDAPAIERDPPRTDNTYRAN